MVEIQSPSLSKIDTSRTQTIIVTFLYYVRVVDNNVLVTLNSIGIQQSALIEVTKANTQHLLDHLVTHPNHTLRYYVSKMILHIDSDTAYLVEPKTLFLFIHSPQSKIKSTSLLLVHSHKKCQDFSSRIRIRRHNSTHAILIRNKLIVTKKSHGHEILLGAKSDGLKTPSYVLGHWKRK